MFQQCGIQKYQSLRVSGMSIEIKINFYLFEKTSRRFQMVCLGRGRRRSGQLRGPGHGSLPWLTASVQCESLHLHRPLLLPTAVLWGGCGCGFQCVSFAFTPSISRDSVAAAMCNITLALTAFCKFFISVGILGPENLADKEFC